MCTHPILSAASASNIVRVKTSAILHLLLDAVIQSPSRISVVFISQLAQAFSTPLHRTIYAGCLAFGLPLTGVSAAGLDSSDTREQLLLQERDRALQKQQQTESDARPPTLNSTPVIAEYPEQESPCFTIHSIGFANPQTETQAFMFALDSVTAGKDSALGRCLGSLGLSHVLMRIQQALVKKGYVTTRVLAGEQNLALGHFSVTVVPGIVGSVHLSPDSGQYVQLGNTVPLKSGAVLNLRDVEQGLENLKRIPTAEADIQIEPARALDAGPATSDVVIRHQQAFPFRLTLSADDAGSRFTGKYMGGVTLSGDNLLALSDLFYFNLSHDLGGGKSGNRGSKGHALHYSLPFDYWLLAFNTSSYDYHQQVAGAKVSYIYSGTTENADLKLSRMLLRSEASKTLVSLKGYLRKSFNYIDDTEIEVQRRRTAGWELGLVQNWYLGQAVLDYNLAYKRGTGALHALPAPEEVSQQGTARMGIITLELGYQQPLPRLANLPPLRYSLNLRAQSHHHPLTPQDRFAIGNRYTVRGFDGQQILLGDSGWLIRNDISLPLLAGQAAYLGADYGEVAGPSSEYLLGRRLAGAVAGLKGGYKGLQYDVFVGQPLRRPSGFKTPHTTAGIQLSLSF